MSLDKYITERELRQLQEENCDKIDKYRLARKTIKCWYDELGLKYRYSINELKLDFGQEEWGDNLLKLYDDTIDCPNSWVSLVQNEVNGDIKKFISCCLYIMQKRILTHDFKINVLNLLHEIKDRVLAVRLGGADIERMEETGKCVEAFGDLYNKVIMFCYKYRVKEMLCSTETIRVLLMS